MYIDIYKSLSKVPRNTACDIGNIELDLSSIYFCFVCFKDSDTALNYLNCFTFDPNVILLFSFYVIYVSRKRSTKCQCVNKALLYSVLFDASDWDRTQSVGHLQSKGFHPANYMLVYCILHLKRLEDKVTHERNLYGSPYS